MNNEEQFLRHACEALNESADGLDAATLSKLNQARQRALATVKATARPKWFVLSAWMGAAAAAALVLMVGLRAPEPALNPQALGDLEIVSSADAELLENLAFYEWAGVVLDDEDGQAG